MGTPHDCPASSGYRAPPAFLGTPAQLEAQRLLRVVHLVTAVGLAAEVVKAARLVVNARTLRLSPAPGPSVAWAEALDVLAAAVEAHDRAVFGAVETHAQACECLVCMRKGGT